ncbi:MAG: hypothetical protein RR206_04815 [Bacteroidaceae bacterium]
MNTFAQYIEHLATLHPDIRHGEGGKCRFSDFIDTGRSRMASTMHYPCVVVDSGDFAIGGSPGNILLNEEYSVLFLTHVRDTGSNLEITTAFANTRRLLTDFVSKFSRDKRLGRHPFLNRFSLIGIEAHRISMQDSGLYGWALFFSAEVSYHDGNCNATFDD